MKKPAAQPSGWLPEPAVEYFDDEKGRLSSAWINLREDKCADTFQPNPHRLVFVRLAADGLPIGMEFLEPAVGAFGADVISSMLMGADERLWDFARGANPNIRPMTRKQVELVFRRVREVSARLQAEGRPLR